jgi:hypothetical protein
MRKIVFNIIITVSIMANIVLAVSLTRSQDMKKYYKTSLDTCRAKIKSNIEMSKQIREYSIKKKESLEAIIEKEKNQTENFKAALENQKTKHNPIAPEYEDSKLPELQNQDPSIRGELAMTKMSAVVELMRVIDNSSSDLAPQERIKTFEDMNHTVVINLGQFLATGKVIYLDTLVKELRLLSKMYVNV